MRKATGWVLVIFLILALMMGQVAALATPPSSHNPDANSDQITTAFNTPVSFTKADLLANDSDPSGHTFAFDGITAWPGQGTLTLVGDTFTFVPEKDSSHDQDFQYRIADSVGMADTTTVSLAVQQPEANDDTFTVFADMPTVIDVLANDEGLQLVIDRVYNGPDHGSFDPATMTYTPGAGFSGHDSFKYKLDHGDEGDPAEVDITVVPKPVKPVLTINAVSTGGPAMAFQPTVGTNPVDLAANGAAKSLTLDAGQFTIDAHAPQYYSASLSANVTGGVLNAEDNKTYTVTVTYTYEEPKSALTINTVVIGGTLDLVEPTVTASGDTDYGPGDIAITDGSGSGSVALTAGQYTVHANAPEGFTAVISGDAASNGSLTAVPAGAHTVTITYAAKASVTVAALVVGGPLAAVQPTVKNAEGIDAGLGAVVLTEGSGVSTINLTADSGMTYTLDANTPAGYTAYIEGMTERTVSFGVSAGGEYSFIIKYTFNDLQPPQSTEATLTITTLVVGQAPESPFQPKVGDLVVTSGTRTKLAAGTYTIDANAPTNYTAVINGFEGAVASMAVAAGGEYELIITYTYAPTYPLTVRVQVIGDTDTNSTGIFTVKIEQKDPELDVWYVFDTLTGVIGGTELVRNVPAGTYRVTEQTPLPTGYTLVSTSDAVTVGTNAGAQLIVTNRFKAPVNPPQQLNAAPVAFDDNATTTAGGAIIITVLANDTDADGDALTVTITTAPANGTATVANGQITYTPNAGFTGNDSFTYTIDDGRGGASTATVKVTVAAKTSTEEPAIIIDEPIPGGGATLPKTGGVDPVMFYGVGLAAVVLGAALRKKR